MALSTEASKLLELFRYKKDDEIEAVLEEKEGDIADEAADILFLLARFAQVTEIDLSKALDRKIKEIDEKYPVDKSKGSNKKYTEL